MKEARIHQYEFADLLEISETSAVRWLRKELPETIQEMMIKLIDTKDISIKEKIQEEMYKAGILKRRW